jgi:membrane protein required for colicin V production
LQVKRVDKGDAAIAFGYKPHSSHHPLIKSSVEGILKTASKSGLKRPSMPSYLDIGLIVIILISALLAMLRGFTREVLAIASWGAAALAAIYLHPLVLPYVKPYVSKDVVALALSAAAVFFVVLIIVSLITVKISDAILDSKVGPLDRSLGFVFGAVRGLLLCVIAFVFFTWLVPEKSQPEWVKTARMKPLLQSTGTKLMAMLPDDPEGLFAKLRKPKAAADEPPPEGEPKTPPKAAGKT